MWHRKLIFTRMRSMQNSKWIYLQWTALHLQIKYPRPNPNPNASSWSTSSFTSGWCCCFGSIWQDKHQLKQRVHNIEDRNHLYFQQPHWNAKFPSSYVPQWPQTYSILLTKKLTKLKFIRLSLNLPIRSSKQEVCGQLCLQLSRKEWLSLNQRGSISCQQKC